MSILDVTEEQIFHTLGKGRDPNFKPIEKVRPIIPSTKKTYGTPSKTETTSHAGHASQEQVKFVPSPEVEESVKKLTEELTQLNKNIGGIQAMIKLYIVLFAMALVMMVTLLAFFLRPYIFELF